METLTDSQPSNEISMMSLTLLQLGADDERLVRLRWDAWTVLEELAHAAGICSVHTMETVKSRKILALDMNDGIMVPRSSLEVMYLHKRDKNILVLFSTDVMSWLAFCN